MNSSKNIFLLDSQINFSEINYSNNRDSQIITFDFDSHDALEKKSIPHLISDTLLSKKELLGIRNNAFLLSDWYKEETIEKNIEYENVNLGSLIQAEFINILVNYSKRFLECLNIIRKFGANENYHCSGLTYEIMKYLSAKVEKINDSSDDSLFFPLDLLKIKIKIGIKNHSTELEISQNFFKKLKKFTEKSSIFFSNKNTDFTQKNILISEFNTISYQSLFSKIPESKLNFIFFNRRQPTVWNTKTFSLIKKSGVIIENADTLMNSEMKKKIKNDKKNIEIKINNMFKNADFFNSFFSINGNSFWISFSSHFITYFKKRALEFIKEIQLAKELLNKFHFSFILLHSEVGPNEKILLQLAKLKKITIFLLQHGLINDSVESYDHNVYTGVIPIESDHAIVWGKVYEDYFKQIGIPEEKIHAIGTPIFDNLKTLNSIDSGEDYVLLATSGPTKEVAVDLAIENIEKNIATIKKIAETVVSHNKKLIVKLHPSPDEYDPSKILRKINPEIEIIKTGNIGELIKKCSLFIVIDVSTSIIDAHLLGKPVISVAVWRTSSIAVKAAKTSAYESGHSYSGTGLPTVLENNSCALADISSFEKIFHKMIHDDEFRNKIIKNANTSIQKHMSFHYDGATTLLTFLEKFENKF